MIEEVYTISGKPVKVYYPKSPSISALENLYDCCNELFSEPDCFYTRDEFKKLKKDKSNTFLRKGEHQ